MKPSNEWFDEFVAATRSGLTRYVRRFAPSPGDVQGIVQEAYLRVFCALRESGAAGKCSAGFLYKTARNLAINRLRHHRVVANAATTVTVAEELRMAHGSAENQVDASQRLKSLLQVVNALPPKCRQVFLLRMMEGLSQREIGDRLGISVSTVEKHLARGLRTCKAGLDELRREELAAVADSGTRRSTGT